jgi:maleylacetoacetate isomerase
MAKQIVLYHYWRSSCSWRVRWALELKKVPYKGIPVDLLSKGHQARNYLKKNSSGQVPCLEVAGKSFSESIAILEWIEESFQGHQLLPQSPLDRMRVRELTQLIGSGIQPLQNLKVQQFVGQNTSFDGKDFACHWITLGFKSLEKKLEEIGTASYCFGAQVSMADLALIPQCYNALRFGVPLYRYPIIKQVYDRCLATNECHAAAPENQPGAVVAS